MMFIALDRTILCEAEFLTAGESVLRIFFSVTALPNEYKVMFGAVFLLSFVIGDTISRGTKVEPVSVLSLGD
jgi:hypothetical protein